MRKKKRRKKEGRREIKQKRWTDIDRSKLIEYLLLGLRHLISYMEVNFLS